MLKGRILICMLILTAIIHKEEDAFIAECPEVGTVSQGETIEEATKNLKEATELYLEEFPVNAPRPKGRGFYRFCEEIAFPISEC